MDTASQGGACCETISNSTSTGSGTHYPCPKTCLQKLAELPETGPPCTGHFTMSTTTSSSTSLTMGIFGPECQTFEGRREPPNIGYELAVAKSILQKYSTLSGDNLFDHLSDIIKRVIDERPPNVIDFFEEFSRNVREQKFHLPERFTPDGIYQETRSYHMAKKILQSMKVTSATVNSHSYVETTPLIKLLITINSPPQLPMPSLENELDAAGEDAPLEEFTEAEDLTIDIKGSSRLFLTFYERVQHLQFYWIQCGFSISTDNVFQLACAMDRLQTHRSIMQCRFWGVCNGLKASYYIVEACLTQDELQTRNEQMEAEMRMKCGCTSETDSLPSPSGRELIPGAVGWENFPDDELKKMRPAASPVPVVEKVETFDVPPEDVGFGLNRYSYFVVTAFGDDWYELPIVTPKQVVVSRQIKKFFTGDLEAEINTYPCFPGREKHYLRAMIARITCGTYIAPRGYYRKMTKKEKHLFDGFDDDEMEEEEEEEEPGMEDEEESAIDNDAFLLLNEGYEPQTLLDMSNPSAWVHIRPSILDQGRIIWYDEEKARKEREKEMARLLRLQAAEGMEEEEEEEEGEEEEEEIGEEDLLDDLAEPERGPPLLSPCSNDISADYTIPWVVRATSKYTNKNERMLIMRSNVWPGSFTLIFGRVCETVYMGWGHKYTSRNIPFHHLSPIMEEYPHGPDNYIEATDPTVEEEEAYRLSKLKKPPPPHDIGEQLEDYEDEYSRGSATEAEQ